MAAGTPNSSGNATLSQRELAVVAAAWQSLQGDPKIDFEKFKQLAGYGSADSARVCWRPIKKKLLANSAGTSSAPSPSSTGADAAVKTPKSGSSGVRKRVSTTTKKKAELFSPGFRTEANAGGSGSGAGHDWDENDELAADVEAAAEAQMTPSKKSRGGQKRAYSADAAGVKREQGEAGFDDDDSLRTGPPSHKKGRVTTIQGSMAGGDGGGRIKIEDDGERRGQQQSKEAKRKRDEGTHGDHVEQFFDLEKYDRAEEA